MPVQGEAARENKLIVLNETARDLYELLKTSRTLPQVVEQMLQIYDAQTDEMARDVQEALARLLELGIISLEPGDSEWNVCRKVDQEA